MLRFLLAALLVSGAALAGLGEGFATAGGPPKTLDGLISTEQGGLGTVTIALTAPADPTPVTYSGSFTVTGSATNATAVSWYAHPAGESGSCSGTSSWSCAVAVTPDATGEGVEIVTITATGTGGAGAVVQKRIGFYVTGAHTVFEAQSADGARNTTNADADLLSTWENIGSSAKDITQVGGNRPPIRESIAPTSVVTFDGSNHWMDAATAADWTFLHNGTDFTVEMVFAPSTFTATNQYLLHTVDGAGGCNPAQKGLCVRFSTASFIFILNNGSGTQNGCNVSGSQFTATKFSRVRTVLDPDGGAGDDCFTYINGSLGSSTAHSVAYATDGGVALKVAASHPSNAEKFGGEIMRIAIYQSALTSTQRTINDEVDVWRLHQ